MALLVRDHKAEKAEKLIQELPGEEGELIRYYCSKKDSYISQQNEKIKEMMDVFNGIARFTNKQNLRF